MKTRSIFLLSLIPTFWTGVFALAYRTGYYSTWFGVVGELITVPLTIGAAVLLVMSFISWRREKFAVSSLALYAMLLIVFSHAFLFMQ
ncbi:MAG: hypothetical protein WKF87_05000 [Chryseolinea sp.]